MKNASVDHPAIIATQTGGVLSFAVQGQPYESRGISIQELIKDAVIEYDIGYDFSFKVYPTDQPIEDGYNFSTVDKNYGRCFPCFVFVSYPECGLQSYRHGTSLICTNPETNKVGWIGCPMVYTRQLFCRHFKDTDWSEAIENQWIRLDAHDLASNTPTFMTYQEQVNRWKYLIDFEGCGYSCRTKILIHSPRITFLVDRPYEEFWYENLIPWTHYVPVKRDLSDLKRNYERIESDTTLQEHILHNAKEFSRQYLSHEAALKQTLKIIQDNRR